MIVNNDKYNDFDSNINDTNTESNSLISNSDSYKLVRKQSHNWQ